MNNKISKGFTQIPNIVLENIVLSRITTTQHDLLCIIWRKTYGFHRDEHRITLSYLVKATKRNKRDIQRALKDLANRKIIYQDTSNNNRIIRFNENCDEWKPKQTNGKKADSVNSQSYDGKKPNLTVGSSPNQEIKKDNYKESVISDSITKSKSITKDFNEYFNYVWGIYPVKKGLDKISISQKKKLYEEVPLDAMVIAINKYISEKQGVEEKFIKQGSTWFNEAYQDYLENTCKREFDESSMTYSNYDELILEKQNNMFVS